MADKKNRDGMTLDELSTEAVDPALANIDALDMESRLMAINAHDAQVAAAVAVEIPKIARAARRAAQSFRTGGRLIYVGAGTSVRLGILDAAECPPTFGVPPSLVLAIIAGGERAVFEAVEGAEDDEIEGAAAIIGVDVNSHDTVIGIAASGRTPFVVGALRQAQKRGAATFALTNNTPSELDEFADVTIAPRVGPEVIAGSTRMKCGTSQKLVLNMISTAAMIEIGKTYGNLMVDVQATNEKLQARAIRIVSQVTRASAKEIQRVLTESDWSVKTAILMLETDLDATSARKRLDDSGGSLRRALGPHHGR
jgi:N-acetylmuramic acid 6-phosphate etherase